MINYLGFGKYRTGIYELILPEDIDGDSFAARFFWGKENRTIPVLSFCFSQYTNPGLNIKEKYLCEFELDI